MIRGLDNHTLAGLLVVLTIGCSETVESPPKTQATVSAPRPRTGSPAPKTAAGSKATHAARDAGPSNETDGNDAAPPASEEGADASAEMHAGAGAGGVAAKAGTAAPAGAGGASGAAGATALNSFERGPYFSSGGWRGYFWISHHGAGTTITATNFGGANFVPPVCVKGSVAPTVDYSGNAMLGVNLNQAQRVDASPQTLVPSKDGMYVELTNAGGSQLRVEVQGLDGATNPASRWCASVPGTGGFMPWTSFNTACWDGSGSPYRREPISTAIVMVPGKMDAAVPFEYCLFRWTEAAAPPAGAAGASAAATAKAGAGAAGSGM